MAAARECARPIPSLTASACVWPTRAGTLPADEIWEGLAGAFAEFLEIPSLAQHGEELSRPETRQTVEQILVRMPLIRVSNVTPIIVGKTSVQVLVRPTGMRVIFIFKEGGIYRVITHRRQRGAIWEVADVPDEFKAWLLPLGKKKREEKKEEEKKGKKGKKGKKEEEKERKIGAEEVIQGIDLGGEDYRWTWHQAREFTTWVLDKKGVVKEETPYSWAAIENHIVQPLLEKWAVQRTKGELAERGWVLRPDAPEEAWTAAVGGHELVRKIKEVYAANHKRAATDFAQQLAWVQGRGRSADEQLAKDVARFMGKEYAQRLREWQLASVITRFLSGKGYTHMRLRREFQELIKSGGDLAPHATAAAKAAAAEKPSGPVVMTEEAKRRQKELEAEVALHDLEIFITDAEKLIAEMFEEVARRPLRAGEMKTVKLGAAHGTKFPSIQMGRAQAWGAGKQREEIKAAIEAYVEYLKQRQKSRKGS